MEELLSTYLGTLLFAAVIGPLITYSKAHDLWKWKWQYLGNSQRRTYAFKFRSMSPLYSSPAASSEEREERRVFLTKELSILSADVEQFQKAYPINTALEKDDNIRVISPTEIAHVMAEFSDAKEFIGRELAALSTMPKEMSAQLEFININGSALIEYEGTAVRSIEIDIQEEGEFYVAFFDSGVLKSHSKASGNSVTKVAFPSAVSSGEVRVRPLDGRLSERIPLP